MVYNIHITLHIQDQTLNLIKLARDLTRFLTSKGSWGREIPSFQGNVGWWNILIWPESMVFWILHIRKIPLATLGLLEFC